MPQKKKKDSKKKNDTYKNPAPMGTGTLNKAKKAILKRKKMLMEI